MLLGQLKKKKETLRTFKVGIIGANEQAFEALSRIFKVTAYRIRSYKAVAIAANATRVDDDVDILILCTGKADVVQYWQQKGPFGNAVKRPLIRVTRTQPQNNTSDYFITVPVNPAQLLKHLDHYTIKELKFLPEFKIGAESEVECSTKAEGLKLLQSQDQVLNKRHGLQRALIVDDSQTVRKQLEIEFQMLDAEIDMASSAEEALELVQHTAYDVVFMDVVMSGMDGYSACKRVKKTPLNRETPVILLTSRSSSFDRIKGALAGCSSYLIKPIDHNDFLSVLNEYFSEIER